MQPTCPAWEVARSSAIDGVLTTFADACSKHPVNHATKTARHIHRLGYRDGLRGVFGRWLFNQKEAEIERGGAPDPIIPSRECGRNITHRSPRARDVGT